MNPVFPMKKTNRVIQNSKVLSWFRPKNAKETINSNTEYKILRLSVKDSHSFVAALQNPPQPSEGLLSVFE